MTGSPGLAAELAAELVAELTSRGLTVAVAESLTGGLLVAELVAVPGSSAVLNGAVVAYAAEIKHTVLGVSAALLDSHGPVHPEVAARMAEGVREILAVDGRPADIGIATTGVAGPGPQGGHPAGTAFVAVALESGTSVLRLELGGDRAAIRGAVVTESLSEVKNRLHRESPRLE